CHSLVSITIPNGVTELRDGAFQSCSGLTSITISESVTSIGYYAFAYCNLTSITNLNPEPQEINSDVFLGLMLSNITLYVPAESLDAYGAAGIWKDFGTITAYIPDAINAPSAANAVRAYFDPATGSIRIEGLTAPAQVTVINMGGKTILQQTVAGDGNIPTGHLPRGVYLVNVNGQTVKIIK
ncbi:MAG: leucine-rich repeat domain-containing protein, partial [Dysgonamonadaceae bacterium]|nr:leucine-rich repeat domain-containing protein [Dysgonamonadaceae bacterium]